LEDATLTNEGGEALNLAWAEIKNGAFLRGLRATGEVGALGATIGGPLILTDVTLSNEDGDALLLQVARLGEVLLYPASIKCELSLAGAQIDVLITPEKMDGLTANELDASGWRLGNVRGAIRHNRRAAAAWLTANRGDKNSEFLAQPWHELANVYDRNGQPADARWLRMLTRTSPPGPKLIRWIYGAPHRSRVLPAGRSALAHPRRHRDRRHRHHSSRGLCTDRNEPSCLEAQRTGRSIRPTHHRRNAV
jgi:hypothetical protein